MNSKDEFIRSLQNEISELNSNLEYYRWLTSDLRKKLDIQGTTINRLQYELNSLMK